MEVVIFIGIQAVGKSTFYKEKFFKTHIRINLDMLQSRNREWKIYEACLEAQQPVVIDNTNTTLKSRQRYIEPAKERGIRVIGYYFQSKIKEAIWRNNQRSGKERIPEDGVRAAYNRLVIPSYDEGFDQLYYVYIDANDNFVVNEWGNENSTEPEGSN